MLTALWKFTGLPRTRSTEKKTENKNRKQDKTKTGGGRSFFMTTRTRTFFIDCLDRGETLKFSVILFYYKNNGITLNGTKRETSSEDPYFVRPFEDYHFVIVEVLWAALERRLIANTVL